IASPRPTQVPPGRSPPALSEELAQSGRGVAVDGHLDVVERSIRDAARRGATRVNGPVLARVPAMARQVDSADECDRIIDDDDLLVVRGSERGARVGAKADAGGPAQPRLKR